MHKTSVPTLQFHILITFKHCISYTDVGTNYTYLTQKVVVKNKQYWVQRIKCVGWCEFVFVFVLKRLNKGIKKKKKSERNICSDDRGRSGGKDRIVQ